MLNWNIIHEMDEEDGKPTCWACDLTNEDAINEYGKFIWITIYPDRKYAVEFNDDGEYKVIKKTRSLKSAKEFVEKLNRW